VFAPQGGAHRAMASSFDASGRCVPKSFLLYQHQGDIYGNGIPNKSAEPEVSATRIEDEDRN
jgi:hypothetical protein